MNSNTGVPTLGKAVFDKLPIVLPSLEEQSEIVRRIETLFELADAVESQYIAAKHRVDRINQAILDKAFRGELVKQNPNDVPASELLKHIKSSADDIKPKKKAVSKSTAVKTKINKQVVSDLSERVDENFISDLSAEKHNGFDSLRESHQTEIQKAQELLVDAKFSVEQFRSITEFKGGYDELKALIMNLLKGIPSVSEPVLAIESWDGKSGDYLMHLVKQK
jgi:type I restriction enzyme S subunit